MLTWYKSLPRPCFHRRQPSCSWGAQEVRQSSYVIRVVSLVYHVWTLNILTNNHGRVQRSKRSPSGRSIVPLHHLKHSSCLLFKCSGSSGASHTVLFLVQTVLGKKIVSSCHSYIFVIETSLLSLCFWWYVSNPILFSDFKCSPQE